MQKILIGVCVGAIVLAACGGGGSNKTSAGSGSGNGAKGGNDAFSQLLAKEKTADFKITYTGSDGKSTTFAQDGKGKQAIITSDSEYISDGTTVTQCDGTTSSATCTDLGTTGASLMTGLTA